MDALSSTAAPTPTVEWRTEPGLLDYPAALAAMRARADAIRAGTAPPLIWLVEHPPLYTAGTSARPEELTDPTRFPTYAAGRGGQWTYHGPGQRTVYALLDLLHPPPGLPPRDIRAFVRLLEQWLIDTIAVFGVTGERRDGRIGIWVAEPGRGAENKIGAIGVRVTRWVSWHGMALNVSPDLGHFTGIVPCGIRQHGVTSLRAQGSKATMADVDAALRSTYRQLFKGTAS